MITNINSELYTTILNTTVCLNPPLDKEATYIHQRINELLSSGKYNKFMMDNWSQEVSKGYAELMRNPETFTKAFNEGKKIMQQLNLPPQILHVEAHFDTVRIVKKIPAQKRCRAIAKANRLINKAPCDEINNWTAIITALITYAQNAQSLSPEAANNLLVFLIVVMFLNNMVSNNQKQRRKHKKNACDRCIHTKSST